MVELNWTDEAKFWLKYIHDYIALDNPQAARKLIDGICNKAELLRVLPEIGYKYETPSKENIRILVYGHYRVAYRIISKDRIDILAIIHGKMDINKFFDRYK